MVALTTGMASSIKKTGATKSISTSAYKWLYGKMPTRIRRRYGHIVASVAKIPGKIGFPIILVAICFTL
jgi:hypothetical protein